MSQAKPRLQDLITQRLLFLDGAMGTALQQLDLSMEDFGGEAYEGCNEYLCITRPDVIQQVHRSFLEVGCDILETNTFGGTPLVLDEFDLGEKYFEINVKAAQLAKDLCDEFTRLDPSKPRYVAGSMGPTTKAISVTGGIEFDELKHQFYLQAKALCEGGVDFLLLETSQDTRNIKAGVLGIEECFKDHPQLKVPIAVSGTIEPMGTMLAGQTIEALVSSLEHLDLLYIGLNCATGPEFMTDYIRTLSDMAPWPVACVPNAGLPDEEGNYLENPQMLADQLQRFAQKGWLNLIGGCCGTTSAHLAKVYEKLKDFKPRDLEPKPNISHLSNVDYLQLTPEGRPFLVGERTNVIGSKKFRDLISEERFDEAAEIAQAQVKNGANLIDVCLADPDREELQDMTRFLEHLIKKVRVPLMIDSTDAKVLKEALKYSQGKAIVNSINLEDGEERFESICPLLKSYGAAVIVGCIDEDPLQSMAITSERKLAIAQRSFELLTKKYGLKAEDLYFDPLVFPCASGDENYRGSAAQTIEGIRLIKEHFPQCKTVLGISNVSFGLPTAGREVLNSVFTYHCTQAGLDLAMVNTQHFKRFSTIDEKEVELAENLIFDRTENCIEEFVTFYRGKRPTQKKPQDLPLMERLGLYILEGSKDGLKEDLNLAMKEMPPLEIITGPLMKGMEKVGKLFNDNKLIVAEVLQSAESMKAAVNHLESFMEKKDIVSKGKVLLATVKGDVHDIGKNLVDIVLSNNGYEVINLGIKITSDQLISAAKEHHPDVIGLSGLLVKSAQQMVLTADDLRESKIDVPLLVGGAALTKKFVDRKISKAYAGLVAYAKDAMNGLDLANKIVDPAARVNLESEIYSARATDSEEVEVKKTRTERFQRSSKIEILTDLPPAPDLKRHVLKNTPIEVIWNYINPLMLYGRHLGVKGKFIRALTDGKNLKELVQESGASKAIEIYEEVEKVKVKYRLSHFTTGAVYQYFSCFSEGNSIHLLHPENKKEVIESIQFVRQDKEDGLCLSDFVSPDPKANDNMAFFLVTVGKEIKELSEELKNKGEFLHSHIVQALALESAEAYAEYLHHRLRSFWGHPDPIGLSKLELFQAKYWGKRYSFGYPACPNLDDQEKLFKLLTPEKDIGCVLTDGAMMDPEASVSALAFHHPQATYFSVGDRDFMSGEAQA